MAGTAWLGMALAVAFATQPGDGARPDASPVPAAATPFRTDTVELALAGKGEGSEIDYAIRARAGDVLVYSWEAVGLVSGGEFYAAFHGITASGGQPREAQYREGVEGRASGSLVAPFDGSHGWLFKNNSGRPVKVRLTIAGFYALPSLRESMGLEGPEYIPFGPPDWPDRYGPVQNRGNGGP